VQKVKYILARAALKSARITQKWAYPEKVQYSVSSEHFGIRMMSGRPAAEW
jgi:hypothetical protein